MKDIFKKLIVPLVIGLITSELHASENYPQIEIVTTSGTIVIELDRNRAPKSVENFLNYVESGVYVDTIFHRVIPGFVIQTGGYNVDLSEIDTLPSLKLSQPDCLINIQAFLSLLIFLNVLPHVLIWLG